MKRTGRLLTLSPILGFAAILLIAVAVPRIPPRHGGSGERARGDLWTDHLRTVNHSLDQGDLKAAETAWQESRRAALMARRWEAMLDLGDASLRIGESGGFPSTAHAKARTAYLAALFRARNQGSVDGVLRTAEAFAMLGDREVVEQCVRVAQELADLVRDGQDRERVRVFKERWGRKFGWSQALPSILSEYTLPWKSSPMAVAEYN